MRDSFVCGSNILHLNHSTLVCWIAMKDVELKLIAELMKNSRRSDRELAKAVGVSQPTVSRLISKLQKNGAIKEYTMIPDFHMLGFNLMAIVMIKLKGIPSEELHELFSAAQELDNKERRPYLLMMEGIGLGKDLVIISFHKDYGDYNNFMRNVKESANSKMKAYVNAEDIHGFLIDLTYEGHYQPLTFSRMVANLQAKNNIHNEMRPR
jgi:DNA-binding Lrp family transcriptional regulator